jgi:DNA (cytosine-5)-methyltransferase 3A
VDLLLGGSPCQDLSNAKADRKGLEGEKSSLFFYYLKALRTIKPRYYLLENNYSMSKENQEIITNLLKETYPDTTCTMINSKLVSAQSRKRLYWTNIPNVTQPEDKNIYLQDILEYGYADRDKALCLARRYAGFTGSQSYMCRRYFTKSFGTGVFTSKEDRDYIKNKLEENSYFKDEELEHKIIRPLTCTECERLQTLPDGYTDCIKSEIKRKEAIGNAWTVDVITHILKGITNETTNK